MIYRARWTLEEDRVLREHYPAGGASACIGHMPNRNAAAIRQRACKLDIPSPAAQPAACYVPNGLDQVIHAWNRRRAGGAL